jgi:hypothetical protein
MLPITQNPYTKTRWCDIDVSFELADVTAADDANVSATSQAEISKIEQVCNGVRRKTHKLATLEKNYFLLDGSFELPDETDNGEIGWWSNEISNADCEIYQSLVFTFSQNHSSIGFSIINEFAKDFTIKVYNENNMIIAEDVVINNTKNMYISETPVENYRKVEIIFTKTTEPFRRVRVIEVMFGIIQVFDKNNTMNMNIIYEISPIAESIPSNEISIKIDNSDKKYNMINPKGVYKYLQQGQKIECQIGVGEHEDSIELINMGRFYYTYSKADDDGLTATLIANDLFTTLENSICRIGETGTWTVNEAVAAVISDSGLDITTVIPSNIANIVINKCIPSDVTHREALRLISQAAMCTCYFNREDELVFTEIAESDVVDVLDNDNMFKVAKITDTGRINKIELIVKDEYADTELIYTASDKQDTEPEKVKTINNPLAYGGQEIANWLLRMEQKRIKYRLRERGNPAREICDTVKIYDAYNENRIAVITKEEYLYNGGLRANTEARGESI